VQSLGITRAFIYQVYRKPDYIKSTLKAIKSAGINFVVFLSSYTISRDLYDMPPSEVIPYVYTQIELNLDKVYGDEYYIVLRL
jgi:hypothetical protein